MIVARTQNPAKQESFPAKIESEVQHRQAVDLRIRGLTFAEIGRAMGISPASAFNYFKRGMARVHQETAQSARRYRDLQTARLEQLIRSVAPYAYGRPAIGRKGESNYKPEIKPDPKFGMVMLRSIDRLNELNGLAAPKKVQHQGTGAGGAILHQVGGEGAPKALADLTDEQLAAAYREAIDPKTRGPVTDAEYEVVEEETPADDPQG